MENNFKLTFVDKKTTTQRIGDDYVATLYSGFMFSKFDAFFSRYGFKGLPARVETALLKAGYRRDYGLGMWVVKTTGVAICSPDDTFDDVRGRRIALSRAKINAHLVAEEMVNDVIGALNPILDMFYETKGYLNKNKVIEKDAVYNVIETGESVRKD